MRMNCILATAALLVLSPGIMPAPAAAEDDDAIEPAIDQICGAIENVCAQTCYSNDAGNEYPALTFNCISNCDAEYDECVGDAARRKPTAATAGQTGVGNAPSAVLDDGAPRPAIGGFQGVRPYGTIQRFQFQQE